MPTDIAVEVRARIRITFADNQAHCFVERFSNASSLLEVESSQDCILHFPNQETIGTHTLFLKANTPRIVEIQEGTRKIDFTIAETTAFAPKSKGEDPPPTDW